MDSTNSISMDREQLEVYKLEISIFGNILSAQGIAALDVYSVMSALIQYAPVIQKFQIIICKTYS